MNLEHIYYTVLYACGHYALRAVRTTGRELPREMTFEMSDTDDRLLFSPHDCKHCIKRVERARERSYEKRIYA